MEYVQPMAIGFMLYSAFKMGRAVLTFINAWIILIFAIVISALIPSVFTFPAIVIISAFIANFRKDDLVPYKFKIPLRWSNIFLFFGIFIATAILGKALRPLGENVYRPFVLFENFYRFGAMVFGGGHLLYPLMYEQFVAHKHFLTASEILTGYGIQQALPGPVFSIAAYTGGLTMRDLGLGYEILGGAISAIAIFLPGTLLLFFLFPFWEHLRKYPFIKRSLMGINAAAIGMLLSTTFLSFKNIEGGILDIFIIIGTFILLSTEKIPGALIVFTAIIAAWIW
jgi:chromate transporter